MSIHTAFATIRNPFGGRRTDAVERLARRERQGLARADSLRAQSAVTLAVR
jgi:hypothetical protein